MYLTVQELVHAYEDGPGTGTMRGRCLGAAMPEGVLRGADDAGVRAATQPRPR